MVQEANEAQRQQLWEENEKVEQCTKKLNSNLEPWLRRKFGDLLHTIFQGA